MKRIAVTLVVCPLFGFTTATFADSCNRSVIGSTATGKRIVDANAAVFRQMGLKQPIDLGNPLKCWNMTLLNTDGGKLNGVRRHGFKDFKLTVNDQCVSWFDFSVGSSDPLSHDYCKNNRYLFQLHDESPKILRVYRYALVQHDLNISIAGEFDTSGRKVPATILLPGAPADAASKP
jgi:hypothetical protein